MKIQILFFKKYQLTFSARKMEAVQEEEQIRKNRILNLIKSFNSILHAVFETSGKVAFSRRASFVKMVAEKNIEALESELK